ncbi:MAG: hypothetical protein ACK42D_00365 [Candidatus Paceibacteria bacterium]
MKTIRVIGLEVDTPWTRRRNWQQTEEERKKEMADKIAVIQATQPKPLDPKS